MTSLPVVGGRFGKYAVTGILGHGGMGTVFAAQHAGTSRRVALKVLSPELALRPDFRRRFEREAATLARLYSPHIVDIYDHGEIDGCLFLVTQLVTGGDLGAWLERNGAMEPARAIELMTQVGSALSDAHDAGVIHRDIKPSNVLLHQSTGELFAYLCDFGISQTGDQERTRTRGMLGTLAYTAPERHEGAEAAVASDIYSFGCLFFATLTGRAPYQGTDVQVAMGHLNDPVPTYSGPEPLAGQVNRILRCALAKKPEERYSTVDEMRADLLTAQRGDGVAPPARSRRRWRRPHLSVRTLAVVGAGVVLVAGLGYLVWDRTSGDEPTAGVCWDTSVVADLTTCPEPEGLDGLLWMFPSLDRDLEKCQERTDSTPDDSVQSWYCQNEDSSGAITYTQWVSVAAAARNYDLQYPRPGEFIVADETQGLRWWRTHPNVNGFYKMTMLYRDEPFSTSLYAQSTDEVVDLCNELVVRSLTTAAPAKPRCDYPES